MSTDEKRIRKIINEAFRFSGDRYGFLGQGFGKSNSYDPYSSSRRNFIKEEEEKAGTIEPKEDAWAGGENLEEPMDQEGEYEKSVKSAEKRNLALTESRLRKIIRSTLLKGLK